MKECISRLILLVYFFKLFIIHMDISRVQLGAVISKDNKSKAFYSRKLNPAHNNYTTTESELLSIIETLKEFRNILLGQQIKVYTQPTLPRANKSMFITNPTDMNFSVSTIEEIEQPNSSSVLNFHVNVIVLEKHSYIFKITEN